MRGSLCVCFQENVPKPWATFGVHRSTVIIMIIMRTMGIINRFRAFYLWKSYLDVRGIQYSGYVGVFFF